MNPVMQNTVQRTYTGCAGRKALGAHSEGLRGTYTGRAGSKVLGAHTEGLRCHFTLPKRVVKNLLVNLMSLVQRNRTAHTLLWECEMIYAFWKTVWKSLIKLSIYLFHDPAVTFLGICPREIYVSFIHTSPKLKKKKSKSPSAEKWLNTQLCIYTMEYYSARYKNELLTTCKNIDEFHRNFGESKKPDINGHIPYNSTYMKFKSRQI